MQSFAFSPPVKVNRGSVRSATLPAASGAGFGSGRQLVDPSHVVLAGFGFSIAWTISKSPLDDDAAAQTSTTRLHFRFWTFPRSSGEPVLLALSIPESQFQPISSCEIADSRALLLVGTSGTVVRVNIPQVGRLPSAGGDSSSVAVESVLGQGITAPVIAAGSDGVLYVSSIGSTAIASVTLGQDGSFIVSRHNTAKAPTSSSSGGGWSWVPSVSLSGLLGRRKPAATSEDPSGRNSQNSAHGVQRLFSVGGHCFVDTPSSLTLVRGDGSDDLLWKWNKEHKDGSGRVENILDVAIGDAEVWILAAAPSHGAASSATTILTLSRANADTCTGTMDVPLEESNASVPYAAARRLDRQATAPGSVRLHVLDDVSGTIVTRRDIHRCCVAATVRTPQSHVTEPNPAGVVSFASTRLDDTSICVLTNFGLVSLRGTSAQQDGSIHFGDVSQLNVSVNSNTSATSNRGGAFVTPARGGGAQHNQDQALVDSPRDTSLNNTNLDISAVSAHLRSVTQPQRMRFQFGDVESAEAHGGVDNAWVRASDEIANRLAVNPSNWAKGDLSVDDADGIAFITNELNRRLAHHAALQLHVHSENKWQRLKVASQAAILSRTEALSMYVALRTLHNEACPKADRLRAELFRSAVVAAADAVRHSDTPREASCSEIVYSSVDHAAVLLAAINHGLYGAVSDASAPIKVKVEAAAATAELWMAALDGIETQRASAGPLSAELASMLWTVSRDSSDSTQSFEAVASNFAAMAMDAVTLLVDMANANPGADVGDANGHAHAVVHAVSRVLRFAFANTLRGANHMDALLRRSLLRQPFAVNPVGYPYGVPRPLPLPRVDVCAAVLSTAENIAIEFGMMDALFDLGAADRLDWDAALAATSPDDLPEWTKLRGFASEVQGFYRYFLRRLSQQYREAELFAASKVFERIADGAVHTVWMDFMKKEAPHALWAMHAPAVDCLIASSTMTPYQGLACGDNMAEHRQASLALAELEWVAEGRPEPQRKKLDNEKRVVTALRTHAPHLSTSAPNAEETVRALLDLATPASWASAAAIADAVVDTTSRNKLLVAILSRAFNHDAPRFIGIAGDDSLGERARLAALSETATGHVVRRSPYLQELVGNTELISTATSPAYAGALFHWVCAVFGGPT